MNFDFLLGLIFIPLIIPLIGKFFFHRTVTWGEMGINMGIVFVVGLVLFAFGTFRMTADVQVMNGQVTGKEQVWVSCSHSYSCNCSTDSKGYTTCQTCYDHSNDWDWDVETTVGTLTIDRIDRRGSDEPPRWTAVKIGEPSAVERIYVNYIKAAPESLFNLRETLLNRFPHVPYPKVYDYYRINRVINDGAVSKVNADKLNALLNDSLKTIGSSKQVNVVVAFTKNTSPDYAEAMRQDWLGGKKNDVVVVIGGTGEKPDWVRVFSWSKNDIFNVILRDSITTKNVTAIHGAIVDTIKKHFVRRPMKDYEYLKEDIVPPTWLIVLVVLGSLLTSIGVFVYMHRNDMYTGGSYRRFRY